MWEGKCLESKEINWDCKKRKFSIDTWIISYKLLWLSFTKLSSDT